MKNGTRDFYLERYATFVATKIYPLESGISVKEAAPTRDVRLSDSKKKNTNTPLPIGSNPVSKAAEKNEGVQFKVQILAYPSDIDEINVKKLSRVADLGDFETEIVPINGKRFTRILLSFNSFDAASAALRTVKERSLSDAFIIRYENGKRTNKSTR